MPREMEDSTLGAGRETRPAGEAFVGRDHELTALSVSLASTAAGRGRLDVVSGAPGTGKTRLVQEFASMAEADGFRVLRAGCWDGDGAPPFWPWIQALRDIPGESSDSGSTLAAPELHGLVQRALATRGVDGLAEFVDSSDAQQARFDLFDRFATLFRDLAEEQPLAIVVDDVHRADSGSILLLQFLAGRLADAPMAVCITSRDPLPTVVSDGCRHPWTRHIVLTGLSRSDVCSLLAARAGAPPKPELVDRLMALTDGNPFYLRELGHVLTADADSLAMLSLPPSLAGIAMHQSDALSPTCQSLLQAASVIGREFDADVVATACGIETGAALDLLQEALTHRVVTRTLPMRYRFAHALVREGTYDRLHSSERTHLHERVAAVLEERLGTPAAVSFASIAHHAFLGLPRTDRVRAATFAVAAGREALAACAFEEAVALFSRAKELIGTHSTDSEACDLLLLLGAAQAAAGEWAAARRTFEDAASRARHANDAPRFARAALGFKGLMWATIPVDQDAVAYLEEARERLSQDHPPLQVEVLSALSRALYFTNDTELPNTYSAEAVALATSTGGDQARAVALEAYTVRQLEPARTHAVHASATELLRLGSRLPDALVSFHARIFRQSSLLAHGNTLEADTDLSYAAAIADDTRNPRLLWQIALLRSARATLRGNLALGEALAIRAQQLGQRVHDSSPTQYAMIQAFQRGLLRNDFDALLSLAEAAIERFPSILAPRIGRALLLARLGRLAEASDALFLFTDTDFTNLPENNLTIWLLTHLADAVSLCGMRDAAALLHARLLPYCAQYVTAAWGTLLDGSVSHYLAGLAHATGDDTSAERHFSSALRANRRIEAVPLIARTQLEFAKFLVTTGTTSPSDPHTLAENAARLFATLSLDRPHAEAVALINTLGPRTTSTSHSGPPPKRHHLECNPTPSPALIVEGHYWTLAFAGKSVRLRDSRGLRHIWQLIRANGASVHATTLNSGGRLPANSRPDIGSVFSDPTALSAYRNHLREIDASMAEGELLNDAGLLDALAIEKECLLRELSRSLGLRGRSRRSPSSERARINVRNRITAALEQIRLVHDDAWRHLDQSIRTGTMCAYVPSTQYIWAL